ncbi:MULTISPECIES: DUF6875 domain-containing protein [Bacillus]|uniref:DUF6875 domain-containing protein n=1 Tax=Bacillus TaxID=1386 RepID=UPI0007D04814|nr:MULTISPECIES: hypothetical protein [Bacillus]MCA1214202.1 hypothetical protein [Bacillus amyloliquefaciens]MCC8301769.1 hypothetical protein [Bacillus sp. AF12]MDV9080745.1 hypothetical protein [Bacillus sp. ICE1]OAL89088.1 hypothetical protein AY610_09515 [Bacillus velezensis]
MLNFKNNPVSLKQIIENQDNVTREEIKIVLDYIDFCSKPHPDKGAKGAICPFLPFAIQEDTIYCSFIEQYIEGVQQMRDIIKERAVQFKELKMKSEKVEKYKTLLIVFLNNKSLDNLLATVHREFKRQLVYEGLMIGDFYSTNSKSGLYSAKFTPLVCEVPMMAIRNLIKEDFPFLTSENDQREDKLEFLMGYKHSLENELNERELERVNKAIFNLS